jgi:hypothetical protein
LDHRESDNCAIGLGGKEQIDCGSLEDLEEVHEPHSSDPFVVKNYAVRIACQNGHKEIVELLQDTHVDPSYDDNYAYKQQILRILGDSPASPLRTSR